MTKDFKEHSKKRNNVLAFHKRIIIIINNEIIVHSKQTVYQVYAFI